MKVWATFAKDPTDGLKGLEWPVYEYGEETLVRLGLGNQAGITMAKDSDYAEFCPGIEDPKASIGEPPFG